MDHLLQWPAGGFIGVDIFFVVSGFLITGQLIRQYESTGRISLKDFYLRRIKRILPASLLVLIVTVIAAKLIFNASRSAETLIDGFWAALFSANWRFAFAGTDYFQADGPVSPLQHYWSLSVEEQFYFVWPWIMVASFFVFLRGDRRRNPRSVRLVVGTSIVLLSALSFAWALHETQSSPGIAYFSTLSRAWELGVGAFLAVLMPQLANIPHKYRTPLARSAALGLLLSVFVISSASSFPAPAALFPVVCTAVLIAAGTGSVPHSGLFVFTNRVSGYLGNISFSLYLWHFPVIVFMLQILDEGSTYYALSIVLMLFCAVSCYHLVEDPLRKPNWRKRCIGVLQHPSTMSKNFVHSVFGFICVLTVALVTFVLVFPPHVVSASDNHFVPRTAISEARVEEELPAGISALQAELSTALQADSWPILEPTMDEAINSAQAPSPIASCGDPGPISLEDCFLGPVDASHVAIVMGDSIALTMANPIQKALGNDWKVISYGMYGCSFSSVVVDNPDPAITEGCAERNEESVRTVHDLKPEAVFIANSYAPRTKLGADAPMSPSQWSDTVREAATSLTTDVDNIIFVAAPPSDKDPKECYNRVGSPSDCVSSIPSSWSETFSSESRMATANNWAFIDSRSLYCVDRACPAFAGGVATKSDRAHITIEYGEMIAPALRELMPASVGGK
ncbi:acyltransferase [Arthrobacter sp. zg-Y820]|nr:acyltransferase [Arthrobacter sp. zg-Y820]